MTPIEILLQKAEVYENIAAQKFQEADKACQEAEDYRKAGHEACDIAKEMKIAARTLQTYSPNPRII